MRSQERHCAASEETHFLIRSCVYLNAWPAGGLSHGGEGDAPGVQGELAQFDGTSGVTAWLMRLGFIFDSKSPGLANWIVVFVNLFCFL